MLDNDLDVNGYLGITFPEDFIHVPTQCEVWEIGVDLEYPADDDANASAEKFLGEISGSAPHYFCSWNVKNLLSGVSYGLALSG